MNLFRKKLVTIDLLNKFCDQNKSNDHLFLVHLQKIFSFEWNLLELFLRLTFVNRFVGLYLLREKNGDLYFVRAMCFAF